MFNGINTLFQSSVLLKKKKKAEGKKFFLSMSLSAQQFYGVNYNVNEYPGSFSVN